jgi:hypothetical protein
MQISTSRGNIQTGSLPKNHAESKIRTILVPCSAGLHQVLHPNSPSLVLTSYSPQRHSLFAFFVCTSRVSSGLGTTTRRHHVHRSATVASAVFFPLIGLLLIGAKPALAQTGLQKVNHIIIVMQENHSFDNYFGALAYAPGSPYRNGYGACPASDHQCVDGLSCTADAAGNLTCSNSNLDDDGTRVVAFHELEKVRFARSRPRVV